MTNAYDIADAQDLKVTFTDVNGDVADPTAVTFKMREPDGTETNYTYGTDLELEKSSTGVYFVTWGFRVPGRHIHRFAGTGTLQAAQQLETWVREGI